MVHKILSRNEILTITKDHNSVKNLQRLTHKDPRIDLVKVNASAKFDQIPSISSQDIEQEQNFDNKQVP